MVRRKNQAKGGRRDVVEAGVKRKIVRMGKCECIGLLALHSKCTHNDQREVFLLTCLCWEMLFVSLTVIEVMRVLFICLSVQRQNDMMFYEFSGEVTFLVDRENVNFA
jgi:hypothetical protein